MSYLYMSLPIHGATYPCENIHMELPSLNDLKLYMSMHSVGFFFFETYIKKINIYIVPFPILEEC